MTTIKSYTNIEQSCKLTEILSLESADMCLTFVNNVWNPVCGKMGDIYKLQKNCYEPDYTKDEYVDFDEFEPKIVPCWSLAPLISVLPAECECMSLEHINYGNNHKKYFMHYIGGENTEDYDNPVDACVSMIEKLNELN